MKLVTIKVYSSRIEAEIAKGLLESHSVSALISADDAGGMRPFPFSYSAGVELKVHEKNFKKAQKILESK